MKESKRKLYRFVSSGHNFFFAREKDSLDLLHIYARHRKTPDDAIYIFFHGEMTNWNQERSRYETTLGNECLYWFWLNEDVKLVMVISCFDID